MKKITGMILSIVMVFSMVLCAGVHAAESGGTDVQTIHVKTTGGFFSPSITLSQEKAEYEHEVKTLWTLIWGNTIQTKQTYATYDIKVKNDTTGSTENYTWKDATQKLKLDRNCEYTITVDYNGENTLNRNVQCQDGFTKSPCWKVSDKCNVAECY